MPSFDRDTLAELLLWRMNESPDQVPFWVEDGDGGHRPVSYGENRRATLGLAAVMHERGLARGDRLALLADVSHEWVTVDFADLLAGVITVGIYPTSTPEQVRYILQHSGARWLVVQRRHLDPLLPVLADCDDLELVVVSGGRGSLPEGEGRLVDFDALLAEGGRLLDEGGELPVIERARQVAPDDLAAIVYTSGTTGPPKGAKLTHRNLVSVSVSVASILPFGPSDRGVVFLPLAHILQRYTIYLGVRLGLVGYLLSEIPRLPEVMPRVRPTILVAVPRVLEKIHDKARARAEELTGFRRAVFDWAFDIGLQASAVRRSGGEPGRFLRARLALADRLVLRKVRAALGGEIKLIISGGAPLARRLSEWFHAAGMLVVEGYGLTETSAPATANTPDAFRFGTVGRPIPGTEIGFSPDGEVLVRGPGVFTGYFRDDEATAAAFTDDGFFRTGDLGALDDDGFLKITGRKKDLIITAGGKNVSPSNIENVLKSHPLIGQALVIGDGRPYLAALVSLEPEDAADWARARGLTARSVSELAREPAVLAEVERHVGDTNARLAPYETIKQHTVLPVAFTQTSGHLTPTLKVKRAAILRDFGDVVEDLYKRPRS